MNIARTGLLLAALTALFLVVGYLLGGRSGAVIALAIAIATNVWAWWSSDKMVLRMHGARPGTLHVDGAEVSGVDGRFELANAGSGFVAEFDV